MVKDRVDRASYVYVVVFELQPLVQRFDHEEPTSPLDGALLFNSLACFFALLNASAGLAGFTGGFCIMFGKGATG